MDEILEIVIEIILELIGDAVFDRHRYKPKNKRKYSNGSFSQFTGDNGSSITNEELSTLGNATYKDYTISESTDEVFDEEFKHDISKEKIQEDTLSKEDSTVTIAAPTFDKEIIKKENKALEIQFGVHILKYVFFQDDLKISLKEIKHIKKYFKHNISHLTKSDLLKIKNNISKQIDMVEIEQFFITNHLTQKQFNQAYHDIKKIIRDNNKYMYSLSSIRSTFLEKELF